MWWAISVVGYKMDGIKGRETFWKIFVGLDEVKIDGGGDFSLLG